MVKPTGSTRPARAAARRTGKGAGTGARTSARPGAGKGAEKPKASPTRARSKGAAAAAVPSAPSATPARPADDQASRERILAAAHRVFIRQGTAKARTQEIADEAGVNKALVHYYFGTKEALADAVFRNAASQFMPRIFGILASDTLSIEDKVRAVVREQVEFHLARPYLAGYVISEAHAAPERVRAVMSGATGGAPLGVLRRQLAAAAAAGDIRRISAEHFVVSLVGLLVFPFIARPLLPVLIGVDDDRFPAFVEARKRELPDFFLAGLRP
ncbi:MAG: TetR/AcrR family transcriptional regulator [Gemmatimonadetes bacterium]|nr:TetR/AcrR family transcriptional regulator [Gemmatimonadota bacterium]MBP9106112.1 TetR/AcrR family transcriptional regulator [Gemmatimonadaceae bacterium]MCC7322842.1 TetR/AcrR family transcriptional regulator [Gemmatimonadaceae bacterium]HPV74319.1 TetR/AcrR family transcriptional regulator [Gemmatimonadaceae bacterium]